MKEEVIKRRIDNGIRLDFKPVERTVSLFDKNGRVITSEDFNEWDLTFPTRAVIEIESRCNSGCQYCSFQNKKNGPRLSKRLVLRTIDELDSMQILEISLRGGEATLHPDFEEIWQYAENKKFSSANLITNGLLLNEKNVETLLRKPTSKLIISLDGFPKTNASRNPRQYASVMKWLPRMILRHRNQIVILTCLYRESAEETLQFSRYMAEMGLLYHNFPVLKRQGRAFSFTPDKFLSREEMIKLQEELNSITNEFLGFRPIISCGEIHSRLYKMMENIPVPLFNDLYMSQTVRITTNGEIKVMAGGHFDENFRTLIKETAYLGPLGNIAKSSLSDIWLRQKEIRKKQVEIGYRYYPFFLGWKDKLNDC